MKYVWAGLAVIAAVAALFFRPPQSLPARPSPQRVAAGQSPGDDAADVSRRGSLSTKLVVYVAGDVARPGVYELPPGSRTQAALVSAGGPRPDADLVAVNLAAPLEDGVEVVVPTIGQARPAARPGSRRRGGHTRAAHGHGRHRRTAQTAPKIASVDLNSADETQLETLPGIGPGLATRIVDYRASNGPFTSVDELADVAGVTPRLQDAITGYLVIR